MASAWEQQPSLTARAGRRGRFQKLMPKARASLGARKAVLPGFEGVRLWRPSCGPLPWPLHEATPGLFRLQRRREAPAGLREVERIARTALGRSETPGGEFLEKSTFLVCQSLAPARGRHGHSPEGITLPATSRREGLVQGAGSWADAVMRPRGLVV